MKKIIIYTILLLVGLVSSQTILPTQMEKVPELYTLITFLTYTGLAYIMFFVGLEFDLNKKQIKSYKTDYIVAFTAATFPWLFTTIYLIFSQYHVHEWWTMETWKETLFVGRFAAPTSAGILFTMLAAAGLAGTWVFKKIRVLAIFDDLDTVLLLIPLKVMVIGMAWQLGVVLAIMLALCAVAWIYLRKFNIPVNAPYPILYAIFLAGICKFLFLSSKSIDPNMPIHIEVLFPAFVLGLMVTMDKHKHDQIESQHLIHSLVGGIFMVLVGLNMPYVIDALSNYSRSEWATLIFHVLMITLLSNLGKLFVLFRYSDEATFRERLAVGIGMLPRGEVGAGILVMAIGLGLPANLLTLAMASLVLNLLLTGVFIYVVKKLTHHQSKGNLAKDLPLLADS